MYEILFSLYKEIILFSGSQNVELIRMMESYVGIKSPLEFCHLSDGTK